MNEYELQSRVRKLILHAVNVCNSLPETTTNQVFSRKLLKALSKMGVQLQLAGKVYGYAKYVEKLKIVEEKARVCQYLLGLMKQMDENYSLPLSELETEVDILQNHFARNIQSARNNRIGA